jgi:hypothetical protein
MKKQLNWADIKKIGKADGANRWYPCDEVAEYFSNIRSPSRAWPHSYAKAAQTQKFAKWLSENKPEIAAKFAS